jgi:hypothetical protein
MDTWMTLASMAVEMVVGLVWMGLSIWIFLRVFALLRCLEPGKVKRVLDSLAALGDTRKWPGGPQPAATTAATDKH